MLYVAGRVFLFQGMSPSNFSRLLLASSQRCYLAKHPLHPKRFARTKGIESQEEMMSRPAHKCGYRVISNVSVIRFVTVILDRRS